MSIIEQTKDYVRKRGYVKYHPAALETLAEEQYPFYTDAFGEYWNNAYDVDSLKVETTITPYEVNIEDWGTGVEDFDLFWYMGSPHKRELNTTPIFKRPIIGMSGYGKLSFRKVGKKVEAVTRTQSSKAFYSTIDFKENYYDTTEYLNKKIIENTLPHTGTRFKITELVREIDIKELTEYAANNRYGLMLPGIVTEKPMDIIINQKKVEAKMPRGRKFNINCSLEGVGYGAITGVLLPTKTSKLIDVLRRGVKIKETFNPAPTHPVEGFINVDWLKPVTNRHDFIMDSKEYGAFHLSVRNYLIKSFPSSEEIISKRKIKSIRYLAELMGDIIKDVGLPKDMSMPDIQFKEPEKPKPQKNWTNPTEEPTEKPVENVPRIVLSTRKAPLKPTNKPIRKYGISWYPSNCGKDEPAILVDTYVKSVIFNMDNELMKKCDEMRTTEQRIAMTSLFGSGYALLLNKQSEGMKEYERFANDITAKLISRIKESSQ
jgi:hypothetical protein